MEKHIKMDDLELPLFSEISKCVLFVQELLFLGTPWLPWLRVEVDQSS